MRAGLFAARHARVISDCEWERSDNRSGLITCQGRMLEMVRGGLLWGEELVRVAIKDGSPQSGTWYEGNGYALLTTVDIDSERGAVA